MVINLLKVYSHSTMHRRNVFDDIKDTAGDLGDAVNDKVDDAGSSLSKTEDWIKCMAGDPSFMQMIDFDKDCNRNIEIRIGDSTLEFDALWLWGIVIGLLAGFCLFGVICCRR